MGIALSFSSVHDYPPFQLVKPSLNVVAESKTDSQNHIFVLSKIKTNGTI